MRRPEPLTDAKTKAPAPALGRHVTSHDVAALCGVSQSAVSRCFTPGASISQDTRDRVLKAAAQLGYRPNFLARNLITGKTRIIGVVLAHLDNLFYPRFLQQLAERLQTEGMQVMLFVADAGRQAQLMEQLLNYRVDGIVLAATALNAELAHACTRARIPVVLFNRVPSSSVDQSFHSVQTDQAAGVEALTRKLLDAGHQRIAYLAGHPASSTNLAREEGCLRALAAAGKTLFAHGTGNYSSTDAATVVRAWYTHRGRKRKLDQCPDAIVAADDCMALAVMDTLRHELHIKVPDEVSVVGFDDVPQAAWPAYELSTYAQPLSDMIDAVWQLLQLQIQSQDGPAEPNTQSLGRAVVLPGQLRWRTSARGAQG
jgi:DNA-binding LacI/PurR family transcriptional regulator